MEIGNYDPSSFKILIVDDNPQNIQVLGNMLQSTGYQFEFATSGDEALEWALSSDFDLILLDIMMPEMDGYEVCERLKMGPKTKDIPVIFLTAKMSTDDIVKGFDVGAADYVTKPFNSGELLVRVRTQLLLKTAFEEIKTLRGILPICSSCKKIRDDQGFWEQVDVYVQSHTEVHFSHGMCPECSKKYYPDFCDEPYKTVSNQDAR